MSGSLVVALELVDELGPAEADWEELEEDGGKGEAVGRSCWPETSLQVPCIKTCAKRRRLESQGQGTELRTPGRTTELQMAQVRM